MNDAILGEGGTVMQFVGDAVMAVYGAPLPQDDHADRAVAGAVKMHAAQDELNRRWREEDLPEFGLGIGVSTGEVAAALLGSEERLEYSVVGDSVNLAQRIQGWASAGQIVLSEPTFAALKSPLACEALPRQQVKGRVSEVGAYRIPAVDSAAV
jgi:class 3 adenylate cyclase